MGFWAAQGLRCSRLGFVRAALSASYLIKPLETQVRGEDSKAQRPRSSGLRALHFLVAGEGFARELRSASACAAKLRRASSLQLQRLRDA